MSSQWARGLLLLVSTTAALAGIALVAGAVIRPAENLLVLSAKTGTGLGMLRVALKLLRRLAHGPSSERSPR
jgi:hypothetical protein